MNKLEYTKEDIIEMQNDIDKLQQENKQLKDNWNYIKKMLKEARQELENGDSK